MKTAVVYYSMHGNARYVAEKTAKELGADIVELVPVKAYPDKGAMQFIWGGSAVTFKKKPDLPKVKRQTAIERHYCRDAFFDFAVFVNRSIIWRKRPLHLLRERS